MYLVLQAHNMALSAFCVVLKHQDRPILIEVGLEVVSLWPLRVLATSLFARDLLMPTSQVCYRVWYRLLRSNENFLHPQKCHHYGNQSPIWHRITYIPKWAILTQ